jgi:hypothetical protein
MSLFVSKQDYIVQLIYVLDHGPICFGVSVVFNPDAGIIPLNESGARAYEMLGKCEKKQGAHSLDYCKLEGNKMMRCLATQISL